MRRSTVWTYRNCGRIAATTAIIAIVACVDWSRSTKPAESSSQSDYVATGVLFSAVWWPTAAGAEFGGSASVPVELSAKQGVVNLTKSGPASTKPNVEAAQRLHRSFNTSALLSGNGSGPASPARIVGRAPGLKLAVKARYVSAQKVNGKSIRVAFVEDAGSPSGQPPRASLVFVNGKLAAVREAQYARRSGQWRAVRTRTTMLDSTGKSVMMSETDASGLEYHGGVEQVGRAIGIRDRAGRALSAVIRLAQPDVLEAATMQGWGSCILEEIALAVALERAYSAWLAVESAQNARTIAQSNLETAQTNCQTPTEACLDAVERAQLALDNAQIALERAEYDFYAADALAGVAGYNLWKCYNRPAPTTGTGGGRTGPGQCEEWCEYTIYMDGDGNVVDVVENYCWCEYET
jgi:hypothetical protein